MFITTITSFFTKSKIYVILILLATSIIGGVYFYIQHLRSENEILTLNNSKLESAVEVQKQSIDNLEIDIEAIKTINKELNIVKANNQLNLNKLDEKFTKNMRDFTYLAYKKPGLIENIINKATKDRLRCFEIISGASIDENEKNSVCDITSTSN